MQDNEVFGWIRIAIRGLRWKCNTFEHDPGFKSPPVYMDTGKMVGEVWKLEDGTPYAGEWRYRVYHDVSDVACGILDEVGLAETCAEAMSQVIQHSRLDKEV